MLIFKNKSRNGLAVHKLFLIPGSVLCVFLTEKAKTTCGIVKTVSEKRKTDSFYREDYDESKNHRKRKLPDASAGRTALLDSSVHLWSHAGSRTPLHQHPVPASFYRRFPEAWRREGCMGSELCRIRLYHAGASSRTRKFYSG